MDIKDLTSFDGVGFLAVLVQCAPYRKARKRHLKSQKKFPKKILKSYVEILESNI